jgi:hypothetical protein
LSCNVRKWSCWPIEYADLFVVGVTGAKALRRAENVTNTTAHAEYGHQCLGRNLSCFFHKSKSLKAQQPDAETPGRHLEPIALGRSVGLVPTNASTCAPVCAPAGGGVIACACRRGAIVCTSMHSTIDASNAHRCQGTPNSSVRSIK